MEYQRGEHDPNGAALDPRVPRTLAYRMAHEIQEAIEQQVATSDYTVGRAERADMAFDYANMLYDQNAVEPASLAFDALIHWRRVYGGES